MEQADPFSDSRVIDTCATCGGNHNTLHHDWNVMSMDERQGAIDRLNATEQQNKPFLAFAVETLRETKEAQCHMQLCDGDGHYCVAGVLLHTLGMSDENLIALETKAGHFTYYDDIMGIFRAHGYADVDEAVIIRMVLLNDFDHYSFTDIADAFTGGPEGE